MNTLIYAGVIILGAVTLLIEAYRNFNSSLTSIPFREHPILKDMEVAQLCTTREKNIGFIFYSLLYLVTYAIILSSTEIYELLNQTARSNTEIGPTDSLVGPGNDPFGLIGTQYGKPIFISATIIAIFSLGVLRPLESTMRSLSHRIAGVPRGVYNVIEDLHAIEFEAYKLKCSTPLTNMFEQNAEASFEESYEVDQIPTIKSALRTIDYLSPAITGKLRTQYFPFSQLEAMSDLSTRLEKQITDLRAILRSDQLVEEADRTKLFDEAMAVANDTIALFAVHFLRNNRAIKNVKGKTVIGEVYKRIRRIYNIELNSFAMSLTLSFALAIGTATALYMNWRFHEKPLTNESLALGAEKMLSGRGWDASNIKLCIELLPDVEKVPDDRAVQEVEVNDKALIRTELGVSRAQTCDTFFRQSTHAYRMERIQESLKAAFWNMISIAFAIGLAAITALFGRDVRREDNSWPDWPLRRIPFLRLTSMAIVPAIVAVLGVTSGSFLKLWFDAGFNLSENQIAFFFASSSTFFAMHTLLGFIVAVSVLILIDQHDYVDTELSWLMGLCFGIAALAFYYIIVLVGYHPSFIQPQPLGAWVPYLVRETLIYGCMPLFFLLFFSVFLEMTEDHIKGTGSLVLRRLRRLPWFSRAGK